VGLASVLELGSGFDGELGPCGPGEASAGSTSGALAEQIDDGVVVLIGDSVGRAGAWA